MWRGGSKVGASEGVARRLGMARDYSRKREPILSGGSACGRIFSFAGRHRYAFLEPLASDLRHLRSAKLSLDAEIGADALVIDLLVALEAAHSAQRSVARRDEQASDDIIQNPHKLAGSKCQHPRTMKDLGNRLKPQESVFNGKRIEYEPPGCPKQLHKWAALRHRACAQDQAVRTLTEKNTNLVVRGRAPAITSSLFQIPNQMRPVSLRLADQKHV
jgi:hypothetical protein